MPRKLPVLFIAGDKDPVGNFGKGVKAVAEIFEKTGMQNVTCRLYPNARHEVLGELQKEQVFADILDWMTLNHLNGE